MTADWSFGGGPPLLDGVGGVVTMVEGATFCLCTTTGNIVPGAPHGLFARDTRVLSGWVLELGGERLEALTYDMTEPFTALFVARSRPVGEAADSGLLVLRTRTIGSGLHEELVVRNVGRDVVDMTLTLTVSADFADLFEVKEGKRGQPEASWSVSGDQLRSLDPAGVLGVCVTAHGADAEVGRMSWVLHLAPRQEWSSSVDVLLTHRGRALQEEPGAAPSDSAGRLQRWREHVPVFSSGRSGLAQVVARSAEDLGALRIFDPGHPDRLVVAAGAPWFMALFGRDALLTSFLTAHIDASLALGTLQTLADRQGRRVDLVSEEEPGRILHEVRLGSSAGLALGGGETYFGTADATPLFVMVLGELARWTPDAAAIAALLPHADRALAWTRQHGDLDGDGFVEYARSTDRGLVNQGWKDSWDGITFADGRLPATPIALCEVQAYVYAAYRARAALAESMGDAATAADCGRRAEELRASFNEQFWLPSRGWYALGLDADKRPIDALASNMGHCLWAGIVDDDKAEQVAAALLSPEMFSGWGVRTLASSMGAYNPMSYHNGSIWPHDNAIVVAGLMRYGFVDAAQRVALAILDAADHFGGRLPELFCGFDRADFSGPVPYPTSCAPQAWAAATPLHLIRSLLRLEPDAATGGLSVDPVLPAGLLPLTLHNLAFGGDRWDIAVDAGGARVSRTDPAHPRRGTP
jgi:glycogen debranching enzyme